MSDDDRTRNAGPNEQGEQPEQAEVGSALPAFSLLLPVYGGDDARQFERAFTSSTAGQAVPPSEVVLVQDGPLPESLENAVDLAKQGSQVPVNHVVITQRGGLANALTRGLQACANDVVARMDADDVALGSRFEKQLAKLAEGYDLVGTGMLEFADDTSAVIGKRTPPVGAQAIARYARFHDPFNHPTVMYRREAVTRAGGYEDIGLMEDYWLFARMIHDGARVENLAEPLVMYRVGAGAYARRGGSKQFQAEWNLQKALREVSFTSRFQFVRNVLVRGSYRFVPVGVRKLLYRRMIQRGFTDDLGEPWESDVAEPEER